MKYGICTATSNAAYLKAGGWDYVEENVQNFLAPHTQNGTDWRGADVAAGASLTVEAANSFVPGDHKITGPDADPEKLSKYVAVAMQRAQRVGIKVIVFGSGGARMVPEGFDRGQAREQIVKFLKSAGPLAEDFGVSIVVEHLNRTECNILNGFEECADIVRDVAHPSVQLLLDTYHIWMDGIDLAEVERNVSLVRHVHVADKEGRVGPGMSGKADYRPMFKMLKKVGYDRRISVEAGGYDIKTGVPEMLKYLRTAWEGA